MKVGPLSTWPGSGRAGGHLATWWNGWGWIPNQLGRGRGGWIFTYLDRGAHQFPTVDRQTPVKTLPSLVLRSWSVITIPEHFRTECDHSLTLTCVQSKPAFILCCSARSLPLSLNERYVMFQRSAWTVRSINTSSLPTETVTARRTTSTWTWVTTWASNTGIKDPAKEKHYKNCNEGF